MAFESGEKLDEVDLAMVEALRNSKGAVGARELIAALASAGHRISQPTLSRRVERLGRLRYLAREGLGRATAYRYDPYKDYFSVPPTRRPRVAYNFDALASYIPNETAWISLANRAAMEKAGGGRHLDASTYSRAIAQKLLVDLSYASSNLEGNTYSYLDTQVLIEFGQAAEGKDLDETVMILNHKEAITFLLENFDDMEVSKREIMTLHALLSKNLLDPRDVGNIRHTPVDGITGSAYLPMAIPQILDEELGKIANKARLIEDPFEQSLFLMAFISYLQAFKDVNKRTGRLACNLPLLRAGLAPFSFIDMDKAAYVEGLLSFYELNRPDLLSEAFVNAYVKSAARYDAYAGRNRASIELEFRRRADIYACVRQFVSAVAENGTLSDVETLAANTFKDEEDTVRSLLVQRVAEIAEALSEANHPAYGISRSAFQGYEAVVRTNSTSRTP
jgi:hypothetical protein